jgi:hypothetical protein
LNFTLVLIARRFSIDTIYFKEAVAFAQPLTTSGSMKPNSLFMPLQLELRDRREGLSQRYRRR